MSGVLDLLFPKRCIACKKAGSYICANCFAAIEFSQKNTCPKCSKASVNGCVHPRCRAPHGLDGIFSGVEYKGVVKYIVYQFKYLSHLKDLKHTMTDLLVEALNQNETFYHVLKQSPIVTSVPLHKTRHKKRGYNQSDLLAKNLSRRLNLFYSQHMLQRTKNTKPQFKLKRHERKQNIKNAFQVKSDHKEKVRSKTILLIDDLTTTGLTLQECAKVLKRSGAKQVFGVTFARE